MSGAELVLPQSSLGWQLRGALADQHTVRLVLSARCDGVRVNDEGQRVLEGRVSRVSATDAFCVVQGRHVPLSDLLAVHRLHYTQSSPSDPTDPMDRKKDYIAKR